MYLLSYAIQTFRTDLKPATPPQQFELARLY